MKINQFYPAAGVGQIRPSHTAAVSGPEKRNGRNFDSILISTANNNQMEIRGRLTREVRASVTPGRLSALRQQVQDGTYQPDATEIARCMLQMEGA